MNDRRWLGPRALQSLSYATLEQIVQASVHGILLVETHGQRAQIRYVNPAYERLSGYRQRELLGNAWTTHFDGNCPFSDAEALNRAMMRGLPAVESVVCLRKDGSEWRSEVHLSRVGGTAGEAVLILAQHVVADAIETAAGGRSAPAPDVPAAGPSLVPAESVPAAVIPGMLSADQFSALLSRDLAIARRHDRSVTLILFEVMEFDIYRDTFGVLTAEACARMIATQILGTFGRKIDLRARLDPTTFAVAVHEQPEAPADRLAQTVAEKTLRLSLPNPRGQRRHIEVASVCIEAQVGKDEAASLISRARQSLSGDRSDLPRHTLRSAG